MPYELVYNWSSPVELKIKGFKNGTRREVIENGFKFYLDEYDLGAEVYGRVTHRIDLRIVNDKGSVLINHFDTHSELEDAMSYIIQATESVGMSGTF